MDESTEALDVATAAPPPSSIWRSQEEVWLLAVAFMPVSYHIK